MKQNTLGQHLLINGASMEHITKTALHSIHLSAVLMLACEPMLDDQASEAPPAQSGPDEAHPNTEWLEALDTIEELDQEAFLESMHDSADSKLDEEMNFEATQAPPLASQYQYGAAYGEWGAPGYNFTSWDQDIYVSLGATGTFWNIMATYEKSRGYLGLQNLNGKYIALFSIFGATATSPGPNTSCSLASEGGFGYSSHRECKLTLPSIVGKNVRLLLIKINPSTPSDRWYAAFVWVGTNQGKWIGNIQGPSGTGRIHSAMNFTEYFGQGAGWNGTKCVAPGPPQSTALYGPPTVSAPDRADKTLAYHGSTLSKCSGKAAFSNPFNGTIAMHLGDS